jgi:hypothetical protein
MSSNEFQGGLLRCVVVITSAVLFAPVASTPVAAQADKAEQMLERMRDTRYCEIIPVVRRGLRFVGTVYSTIGHNDCPPEIWSKITEAAMKKQFGAPVVVLNGPRHVLMDAIAAKGDVADAKTIDADGLGLTARTTITHRLTSLRTKPYRERTIERDTRFVFKAGQPVFLLVRPDGARYAMQSYPEKPENSLSYADLPSLAQRLKLPRGWRYETMTPTSDLVLRAQNRATIVQDDLDDTYRKIE